jgi:hypothetical protein
MQRRDFMRLAYGSATAAALGARDLGSSRVSYLNDSGRGRPAGRAYKFDLPSNGLMQWLRPESLTGSDGTPLDLWQDSSGNGKHATQSGSNRPVVRREAYFNYAAARFTDADAQFLLEPNLVLDRRNHSVFMVVRKRGYTNVSYDVLLSGPAPYYILYTPNTNPGTATRTRLAANMNGTSFDVNQRVPCGPTLLGLVGSAAESKWIVNRDASTQAAFSAGTSTLTRAGANTQVGYGYYNGDLFEVAVYSRALSTPEIAQVQAYFESRYGAPGEDALIVCDGNSITAGHMTAVPYSWPNIVQSRFMYRHTWVNEGIPSIQTPTLTAQAPGVIDPQLNKAKFRHNIVVFWEISNHLSLGAVDATTAYNAAADYCRARRAAGWKVVILTVLPRQNDGNFETRRQAVNASIRANWTGFADALADVGSDSVIAANAACTLDTNYYPDQIHLTRRGQEIVSEYIYRAIAGLIG